MARNIEVPGNATFLPATPPRQSTPRTMHCRPERDARCSLDEEQDRKAWSGMVIRHTEYRYGRSGMGAVWLRGSWMAPWAIQWSPFCFWLKQIGRANKTSFPACALGAGQKTAFLINPVPSRILRPDYSVASSPFQTPVGILQIVAAQRGGAAGECVVYCSSSVEEGRHGS